MGDFFAGGTFERLPSPKAAAAFRFFEYAPKPPLATLATLARFGKQLTDKTAIALVCPKSTWLTPRGAMRQGPELDAGLDWIKRVADILRAPAIVVATGAELTTGERDRTLLASFLERLKPTGRLLIAAPRGLWEPEHGAAFAQQSGTIYGFDPLESDAPEGDIIYARVRPMGARPRLTDGHLAQIAERLIVPEAARAYVSIESDDANRDAKRLQRLLREVLEEHAAAAALEDELDEDELDEESEEDEEEEDGEGEEDDEDEEDTEPSDD